MLCSQGEERGKSEGGDCSTAAEEKNTFAAHLHARTVPASKARAAWEARARRGEGGT